MDKYYYLVCSLPFLSFGKSPGISKEQFIAEAEKWLSPGDFHILTRSGINNFFEQRHDTLLLKKWKGFEFSLRNELALFRQAKRQNREYKIRENLAELLEQSRHPLDAEQRLLLYRWNFLEEQAAGHFFDLDFLSIYYLKLQILERLFSFDKQKGQERFEAAAAVAL